MRTKQCSPKRLRIHKSEYGVRIFRFVFRSSAAQRLAIASFAHTICCSTGQTLSRIDHPAIGGTHVVANAVSSDGTVVVGHCVVDGRNRPFLWAAPNGSLLLQEFAGDTNTIVYGTSGDGSIFVGAGFSDTGGQGLRRWLSDGTVESLGSGGRGSSANLSGDLIVGEFEQSLGTFPGTPSQYRWRYAALWEGNSPVQPMPGGIAADITIDTYGAGLIEAGFLHGNVWPIFAAGVSYDGSVIAGTARTVQSWENRPTPFVLDRSAIAYRWTPSAGVELLGTLPGHYSSNALAVSGDGSTIVGLSTASIQGGDHAFRYADASGIEEIVGMGRANAVNGDGSVVGGESGTNAVAWSAATGPIWLAGWLADREVDLNGWQLREVTAISEDGRVIVGLGFQGSMFVTRSWRLELPCSLAVCAHGGDVDCDGNVDISDLTRMLSNFGRTDVTARSDGDLTGDGAVDLSDLTRLLSQFGLTCP